MGPRAYQLRKVRKIEMPFTISHTGFAVISSLIAIFLSEVSHQTTPKNDEENQRVICYYFNWARYLTKPMDFYPDNIPLSLCDDLVYYYTILNETTYKIQYSDEYADVENGDMDRVSRLRTGSSSALVAVGGWNKSLEGFSKFTSRTNRITFIESVVDFLMKHKYNGLLLDWEWPGESERSTEDHTTYLRLVKDLKTAFKPHKFKLAISAPASISRTDSQYNIIELNKYVDQIHVSAFEIFGYWSKKALSHSPLKPNVLSLMDHWINGGVDKHKLYMGISLKGITSTLTANSSGELGSAVEGPGKATKYTNYDGGIAYYEVCINVMSGSWKEKWDQYAMMPYAYSSSQPHQWASYENPRSAFEKAQYAKQQGFGGVFVYALNADDFRGLCGPKFANTKAIRQALFGLTSN